MAAAEEISLSVSVHTSTKIVCGIQFMQVNPDKSLQDMLNLILEEESPVLGLDSEKTFAYHMAFPSAQKLVQFGHPTTNKRHIFEVNNKDKIKQHHHIEVETRDTII